MRRAIRTRIVCTIGGSSERMHLDLLQRFLQAGMDVARVNMSHSASFAREGEYAKGQNYEADRYRLTTLREASYRSGIPLAILGDIQGPKIRLGTFADPNGVELTRGQTFSFYRDPEYPGDTRGVHLPQFEVVAAQARALTEVWLADGLVQLTLSKVDATAGVMSGVVECPGRLSNNKGAIFKGVQIDLSILTEKDRSDLRFLLDQGVDFLACSFVRTPEDITVIRALMGDSDVPLIAKIETAEALEHLDAILRAVDGAMVARGDLGVRLPVQEVPLAQKNLIERGNALGIPVITATQMLDSMEQRPIPTRAEASDVANAILDGTDALMLSGETATGKYPIEAITTLVEIAARMEGRLAGRGYESESTAPAWQQPLEGLALHLNYAERNAKLERAMARMKAEGAYPVSVDRDIADAIARAAADIAEDLALEAILCPTASGGTPRLVARFRPKAKIIGAVESPKVARRLLLTAGVTPLLFEAASDASAEELLRAARIAAVKAGVMHASEHFLFTAGWPLRQPGSTNLLKVHKGGE